MPEERLHSTVSVPKWRTFICLLVVGEECMQNRACWGQGLRSHMCLHLPRCLNTFQRCMKWAEARREAGTFTFSSFCKFWGFLPRILTFIYFMPTENMWMVGWGWGGIYLELLEISYKNKEELTNWGRLCLVWVTVVKLIF